MLQVASLTSKGLVAVFVAGGTGEDKMEFDMIRRGQYKA